MRLVQRALFGNEGDADPTPEHSTNDVQCQSSEYPSSYLRKMLQSLILELMPITVRCQGTFGLSVRSFIMEVSWNPFPLLQTKEPRTDIPFADGLG